MDLNVTLLESKGLHFPKYLNLRQLENLQASAAMHESMTVTWHQFEDDRPYLAREEADRTKISGRCELSNLRRDVTGPAKRFDYSMNSHVLVAVAITEGGEVRAINTEAAGDVISEDVPARKSYLTVATQLPLNLIFPNDPSIVTVLIYRPVMNGDRIDLSKVGEVSLRGAKQ